MDVVKTNLDQLGGGLEIESMPGKGTTFALELPLTLAIIPCLLVTSGDRTYALPQKDLEELVCVHPGRTGLSIERTAEQEVIRRRGRLLPLVRLASVLLRRRGPTGTVPSSQDENRDSPRVNDSPVLIAVVKAGTRRFGLAVDGLVNSEEIVVKPMHGSLRRLEIFSGATILGDGNVALILNADGIARHARIRFGSDAEATGQVFRESGPETQSILLFRHGGRQFAVPMRAVRRIVMVRRECIERVGDGEFVVLEGVPTRLLRLERWLDVPAGPDRPIMFMLLPRGVESPMGFLVEEILDSDRAAVDLYRDAMAGPGVAGTAVLRGRLTSLLDLAGLVPGAGKSETSGAPSSRCAGPAAPRILFAEDTQFFRELVAGYLQAAGYQVRVAENGAEALDALRQDTFDLVISDLEMPVMDGWTLAATLRRTAGMDRVPLLALTTLASEADRAKALACGFDAFEVKLDRGSFLATVERILASARPVAAAGGITHG
jgi:two-component system chemotaxis sensor kinase CheA